MGLRAFRIAYDGRPFYGFQRQPDVSTVENVLFEGLSELDVVDSPGKPPDGYTAAGRTDAGVSAIEQTIAFDAPGWLTPRAFNSTLPGAVRVWAQADAPATFHATHDALRREYTYWLYAPTNDGRIAPDRPIDDDLAERALEALCGSNDMHNLTPDTRNTRRGLSGRLERDGEFLVVEVAAGGFSRELVRRLITVVRSVGTGEMSIDRIDRILGPEPLPGSDGVPPAPPEPLYLSRVVYGMAEFEPDPVAADSAAAVFGDRAGSRLAAGRVACSIAESIAAESRPQSE